MSTRYKSHETSATPASRRLAWAALSIKITSVVFLFVGGVAPYVTAQDSSEPPTGGFQSLPPEVPTKLPPLSQRFQEASSFIDSLSKNDAMFEVVLGQGRLIVLKENLVLDEAKKPKGQSLIAVGNPDVLDFEVVGQRQIRLVGKQIGITDFVVMTENEKTYSYEVHVVYDLNLIQARIRELLPDAQVRIAQLGKNLVVEGQARDATQIRQITELVQRGILNDGVTGGTDTNSRPSPGGKLASPLAAIGQSEDGNSSAPEIINLMRVPGPQQVMLKVQVAELNRTAMRQIGSDLLFADGNGRIFGSRLNNTASAVTSTATGAGLAGLATTATGLTSPTTAFAIFEGASFQAFVSALRQNSMLKVLAEPNLVAMNGHEARFLAGGEFPVPVPQSGAGGGAATITIQYKKFGVQLNFVPYILDGDTIRLSVDPEVSSVDFSLGIEVSGTKVPGLNTRNAHTVVELQEGQTLAIAGLMQLQLSGDTRRIPGLGDLPYIGPFFSNTTGARIEKELVVLVTPYLVEPMRPEEVPSRPGDEVYEPNDLEFYLLGRTQGRTGNTEFRSTTNADDPLHFVRRMKLENGGIQGPHGYLE